MLPWPLDNFTNYLLKKKKKKPHTHTHKYINSLLSLYLSTYIENFKCHPLLRHLLPYKTIDLLHDFVEERKTIDILELNCMFIWIRCHLDQSIKTMWSSFNLGSPSIMQKLIIYVMEQPPTTSNIVLRWAVPCSPTTQMSIIQLQRESNDGINQQKHSPKKKKKTFDSFHSYFSYNQESKWYTSPTITLS